MKNLEIVGEGKTTKVYRDGEKAYKLYTSGPPDEAYNESKKQRLAFDAGLPVPRVYGVEKWEEGTALVMDYVSGKELVERGMDKNERRTALGELVKLQCTVYSADAAGLPRQSDALAWKIEHAPVLAAEEKEALLTCLKQLDTGKTNLCHGDFHTSNVLRDGGKLWIIDWVDATSGEPLADGCRTYLLLRMYISRMAGIYLRSFCKELGAKEEDVLAWMPIVAAGRLRENLTQKETDLLLGIVREGLTAS